MTDIKERLRDRNLDQGGWPNDYGDALAEIERLEAENATLQASNQRMEAALRRARDDMEGWAAYAAPNFREKWDLDGDLAAIDEALTLSTQPVETDEERDERRADVIDPEAALRRVLFGQVEPWDIALSKARAIAESDKKAGHG